VSLSPSGSSETSGWVRTRRDGAVLTVTLDRADQLNAQTPDTWTALAAVGASLEDDVRVVVVRGEGRSFSAGLDRSLFSVAPGTAGIVSIAAVQGHAIGAGAQLALACDLRVVADDAQFRLPEATLGLVPDLTGTSTLTQLVGYSRAMEICLTGRAVQAAEARAIGLANIVVPAAELDATVADLASALLAAPVAASRATAALVRSAVRNDFEAQDAAERAAQVLRLQELVGGR
jgi:enoyl-CoA hydratase/carnithine racemase